jgi:hypothetical protein
MLKINLFLEGYSPTTDSCGLLWQFPQSDKQEVWITIFHTAKTKLFKLLKAVAK